MALMENLSSWVALESVKDKHSGGERIPKQMEKSEAETSIEIAII